MQQWEFMYVQGGTGTQMMSRITDEVNKLGALGWEPIGMASADKTIGMNSNIVILRRPIDPPLPVPVSNEEWQTDPSGRFDKRRWDAARQVWTAETAMMEAKTLHVDPPRP